MAAFDVMMMTVFLKSMSAAFAVFHVPLVEHLEENILCTGMPPPHPIQQDDGIRPPANRLGQDILSRPT